MTDLMMGRVGMKITPEHSTGVAQHAASREEEYQAAHFGAITQNGHHKPKLTTADFERSAYLARDLLKPNFVSRMYQHDE